MAVLWTTPELASRFAPYIEELHEFFASYGMHYGSADDMVPLTERLDASGTFAEDLSSMVRAIILREGGSMPRADLLEIIAVAIGGPEIDQAAQELQPPVHKLLGFLNGVLRRPWNEPPGEDLPSPTRKPIEFPTARVAPAFVRPESVFSRFDRAEINPEPLTISQPSAEPAPVRVAESIPELASFPPPEATPGRVAEPIRDLASSAPPDATPVRVAELIRALGPSTSPEAAPATAAEPMPRLASLLEGRPWRAALPLLSRFKFSWPPRSISPPMRSALMAGSGVLLLAVFLILFLHRTSPSPTVSNSLGIPAAPANYAPASVPAATVVPVPVPTSKPSPNGPVLTPRPHFGRTAQSEETIADPYSTPIPGQNSAPIERRPSPGRSNAAEPSASDFPTGSTSTTTAPPDSRPSAAAVDPDSTFVGASAANQPSASARYGDSSRTSADRPITPAYSRSPSSRGRYFSVSSGVMAHNLISSPAPNYPMLARLAHIHGQVILQAVVAKDGSVSAMHVLRGHRLLRGAAVDAVSRWRFRPYMMEGRPVDVSTIVTVDFNGAQ